MKSRDRLGTWKALRRLWRLAKCRHRNTCIKWQFEDTTEIIICRRCGRVLSFSTSGERRHNPHLDFDQGGDRLDK